MGDNDTLVAKIVAICVLFIVSMILGTLPIKLASRYQWTTTAKNNIYVRMLLSLGGGVLLSTTFLHLLPEVSESIEANKDFPSLRFPPAELLMCMGFFLMYLTEEVADFYVHKEHKRYSAENNLTILENDENCKEEHPRFSHIEHSHVLVGTHETIISLRGFLVILALSVHAFFEGLAVGLEGSATHVWYMFGAVAAHKFVISFCIGVELATSGMKTVLVVSYIFIFAAMSSAGIGVGTILTEDESSSMDTVAVILQGLAGGTLVYVIFFEILKTERKGGIKQYFAVLTGFVIMLLTTLLEEEEHAH